MNLVSSEINRFITEYESSVWYDYNDIYLHTGLIYKKIYNAYAPPIFISIGRGGWIFQRILSTYYERDMNKYASFTVITCYKNRNSPKEKPDFCQNLDNYAASRIKKLLISGAEIIILDVPYVTGGTMNFVKNYLEHKFDAKCKTAVLHAVEFKILNIYPWRKPPKVLPNYYAVKINSNKTNWYVQYPWEWTNLELYNLVCDSYRNKLTKTALITKLNYI